MGNGWSRWLRVTTVTLTLPVLVGGVLAGGVLAGGVAQAKVATERPGLLSSVTAPCDFKTVNSCESTDPAIKTYVVLSGSLNGCTFDFTVNWGDNSKAKQVTLTNPKDGTDFLAGHTYRYSNQNRNFTIDVSATVIAGNCTFQPGSLSFTLLACTSSQLSGPSWASKFPDSKSVSDLASAFGKDVSAFAAAMKHSRITVRTLSTLRPPERAYLMHYSWLVAKRKLSPLKVPGFAGSKKHPPVGICWVHATAHGPSKPESIAAAGKLAAALGVASMRTAPELTSLRTEGQAIVMSTTWSSRKITIKNASGHSVVIRTGPRDGLNAKLIAVGATYGVIHFRPVGQARNDWSVNGQ
jgi:hypothetical protein